MAGGSDEDVARVRPVLETVGANVVHVGGPGAGHMAKVANQVIVGLALEGVAEALALVEAPGLDPRLVQQALRGGWADSRILQGQGTRMIERDFVPGGKVRTLRKDLAMALGVAADLGLELPHLRERVLRSSTGSSSAATAISTAPRSTRSGRRRTSPKQPQADFGRGAAREAASSGRMRSGLVVARTEPRWFRAG